MAVRSFWGWGNEGEALKSREINYFARLLGNFIPSGESLKLPPRKEDLKFPKPRFNPPKSFSVQVDYSSLERARHCYGRSFKDVFRGLNNDFTDPPDAVIFPKTKQEVIDTLDYCQKKNFAVNCYGGGSSVVGGVEIDHDLLSNYSGWISMDMTHMNNLVSLDKFSRSANFQGGILGPALEKKLKRHNLTLRHFPQSFEFSSLGGWIATRAGGHFATGPTHIDDLLEALEVVTPIGTTVTRRLPASGAATDENRLWLGSEGILGIITSAWVKVQPRPTFVAKADIAFDDFKQGIACLKEIAQSGLNPTNCRLLDPVEAFINRVSASNKAILLLGFESYDHEINFLFDRGKEICRSYSGELISESLITKDQINSPVISDSAAESWKASFIKAPYVRDALIRIGLIVETFETAVTWDGFDKLYFNVIDQINREIKKHLNGNGWVTCRITHAYPNGLAPYFSVIASGRSGSQISQWNEIKRIASETLNKYNGTITHHHAVGKDHREGYYGEKSEIYIGYLKNAKKYFDPESILSPGNVLKLP